MGVVWSCREYCLELISRLIGWYWDCKKQVADKDGSASNDDPTLKDELAFKYGPTHEDVPTPEDGTFPENYPASENIAGFKDGPSPEDGQVSVLLALLVGSSRSWPMASENTVVQLTDSCNHQTSNVL